MCCVFAVNRFTVKSVDFLAKSSSVQVISLQSDLELCEYEKLKSDSTSNSGAGVGRPRILSSV